MKLRATSLALAALASLALGSTTWAASIGLNFVGGGPNGGAALAPTDVAGHPRYAQGQWNNAAGNVGVGLALKDSSGGVTPAQAAWSSNNVWALPGSPTNANERLMDGYLDTTANSTTSVTITNIPFAKYDVVVYFDGNNGSGGSAWKVGTYTIGSTTLSGEDSEGRDFYNNGNTNGTGGGSGPGDFFQLPVPGGAGNQPYSTLYNYEATPGNNNEGNFLVFHDVDLPSLVVLTSTPGASGDGGGRAPLNAIQIISNVPEPATATLGFLVLAGLGAVTRRRRMA
jgi:uncharacterized protein (TIGR03382 family)